MPSFNTLEWIMTLNSAVWCGLLVLFIFSVGFSILSWSLWFLVTITILFFISTALQVALGCVT